MAIKYRRHGRDSLQPFLDWLPLEDASVLEVGCFAGDGTCEFLGSPKVAEITCVDLFMGGYDDADLASQSDMTEAMNYWMLQVSKKNTERKPVTLMAYQDMKVPFREFANLHKYDLIYIDASHLFEAVSRDITLAMGLKPKIIAGHDYSQQSHPGVKQAVEKHFSDIITFPDSSWAVVL